MDNYDSKLYRKIDARLKLLAANYPKAVQKGLDNGKMIVCGQGVTVLETDLLLEGLFQLRHRYWEVGSNKNLYKFLFLVGKG